MALFAISLRILVWLYHFFYFDYVVSCVPCGSLAIILSFSYKLINLAVWAHPEGIDSVKVRVSEVCYNTLVWLEKDSLLAVRWSRYDCLTWVYLRFKARNSLSLIVFTSIVFLWRCWFLFDYRSLLLRSTRRADYLWQAHVGLWKSRLMPTWHSIFFLNAGSAWKTVRNLPLSIHWQTSRGAGCWYNRIWVLE